MFSLSVFSQKSVSDEISDFLNVVNKITLGKKATIDEMVLGKHLRNMPGMSGINKLVKEYESSGKWLNDGLIIPEEIKPNINVKGETLVYFSKMNAKLETAELDLSLKAYLTKSEESGKLERNYYMDYIVHDAEGNQLLNLKIAE
jgi:hypothetical protein